MQVTGVNNGRLKKILFVIFIVALFLRVLAVITQEESKKLPTGDASQYNRIAVNIVSGNGFSEEIHGKITPTARRTPMYPLFLAGIYAIFGHNYMAVKIIQAVLGALLCMVAFFIAYVIYNDRMIAISSSMLVAIYKPFFWGFHYYGGPALLFTEYLYMFVLGLAILLTLLFIKGEDKKIGILSGIFIGLTILTRPEFALDAVVLLFYLFYISGLSIKKFIKKCFVVPLFITLTMSPWVLRNYIVYERFVPLSSIGGVAFWAGNNSSANGGWANPGGLYGKVYSMENLSDFEKSRFLFNKAIDDLKSNPKRLPKLFIKRILVHWAPFEEGFDIFNPYYAVILLFGAIGILFFRRRNIMENVLLVIFFSETLKVIILFGDPRWRYPYEFFLIVFAALAMNKIFVITQRKILDYGKQK